MWKECDVILLFSKSSPLFRHVGGDLCFNTVGNSEETAFIQPFHLYIVSDDEINKGDWHYNSKNSNKVSCYNIGKYNPNLGNYRKIISSTDPYLNLARPSDKFLKEYCMLGGIDKVMVEYTECSAKDYEPCMKCLGDVTCNNCRYQIIWEPDINSDNTIIIKKIKDSWNRNEVDMLLREYLRGYHDFAIKSHFPVNDSEYAEFHKLWVEGNL